LIEEIALDNSCNSIMLGNLWNKQQSCTEVASKSWIKEEPRSVKSNA
jgi:hypothetical protein